VWVTLDGVAHTVALPNPRDVLATRTRVSFATLRRDLAGDVVGNLLDGEEEAIFENDLVPDADKSFVDAAPPRGILDADVSTADRLRAAVQGVDLRWRLDVVLALQDLIDAE
jgi:hypothetical protein